MNSPFKSDSIPGGGAAIVNGKTSHRDAPRHRAEHQPGPRFLGNNRWSFEIWAPQRKAMTLKIHSPSSQLIPLEQADDGYWRIETDQVQPGTRYTYLLDNEIERPDPTSHYQPDGVHGPSELIDHGGFLWGDEQWHGIPLHDMIIYELHVGTFSPQGTFDGVREHLDALVELGVNTIELMPVAQFPGDRNWGYDGAYPYAAQDSYGGPEGLKRLVNECHARGMAVVLDVVYNHLGPEGSYLGDFGPAFSQKYTSAWGSAINFDDQWADGVRDFFIGSALHWLEHYHIDALRLDAIHAIIDMSAKHFLTELSERVSELSIAQGKKRYLIAESELNDTRIVRDRVDGGYGIDGQWVDEFHHAVHTLLTGEQEGYYEDFGSFEHLVKAWREGFVYSWDWSPHRKRRFGSSSRDIPGYRMVVCSQNHDQVGNRMLGERLGALAGFESAKLAAATVLLSPYVPLLFMGEEHFEHAPFQYFVSHTDPGLVEAVRNGRKAEFASFQWEGEPPDPQSEATFEASKLRWKTRTTGEHRHMLNLYTALIQLRKNTAPLAVLDKDACRIWSDEGRRLLVALRSQATHGVLCLFNFSDTEIRVSNTFTKADGTKLIDTASAQWGGPGEKLPEVFHPRQQHFMPARSACAYSVEL